MNAKQFIEKHGRERARLVAEVAGTNLVYFIQIANGHRNPSRKLAKKLVDASDGDMTFVELMMPCEEHREAA